jgi:hypothetical protein
MTKLSVFTILAIIYLGVVRVAQFVAALFVIVFFGMTTYELIRNLKTPARRAA